MFLVFREPAGRAAVVERCSLRMSGVTLWVRYLFGWAEIKQISKSSAWIVHLLWAGEIPVQVFHQPAVERLTAYSHSRILSALYRATEILVQVLHRPDLGNLTKKGAFVASFPLIFRGRGGWYGFLFRSSVDQVWQSLVTEAIKKCTF